MGFEFASAAGSFLQGIHPRLVWSQSDHATLMGLMESGSGALLRDAFMALARADAARILTPGEGQTLFGISSTAVLTHGAIPVKLDRLAVAAWLEPEDETLTEAARLMARWIAQQTSDTDSRPYTDAGGHGMALAYDLLFEKFTNAERTEVRDWMVQIGVRRPLAKLRRFYLRSPGANIPLVGAVQALVNLLAVYGDKDVPDLSAERDELVTFLDAAVQSTTGPAGYPAEDIGYGTNVASRLFTACLIAGRAGWYDVAQACPQFLQFGRAILHFVQPGGVYLSNTGDHGDDFGQRELILPRLAVMTSDPSLLWLSGTIFYPPYKREWMGRMKEFPELALPDGTNLAVSWLSIASLPDLSALQPRHPARLNLPTSYVDQSRGIVSFRSSWADDATYVYLDGGHRPTVAQGHEHDSAGHFALSALGEYFAISPGRYNMDQTNHSVVLVDGKTGHDIAGKWRATYYRGRLTGYQPGPVVDCASVDNSQQSNCYWSFRTLGLVKSDPLPAWAWTLDDVNADHGVIMPRDYWWTLHCCPGSRIQCADNRATVIGPRHGHALDVFFATPDSPNLSVGYSVAVEQDESTPSAYDYIPSSRIEEERTRYHDMPWEQVHGPVYFRPRLIGRVTGPNGKFLTLMVPRRKDEPVTKFTRLPAKDAQIAVSVEREDTIETLICAYGHKQLDTPGIDARGDWLLLRRRKSTGKLLGWRLSGGTYLKVDGRRLPPEGRE